MQRPVATGTAATIFKGELGNNLASSFCGTARLQGLEIFPLSCPIAFLALCLHCHTANSSSKAEKERKAVHQRAGGRKLVLMKPRSCRQLCCHSLVHVLFRLWTVLLAVPRYQLKKKERNCPACCTATLNRLTLLSLD